MRQVISQAKNGRENEVTGRRDFLVASLAAAGLAGCAGVSGDDLPCQSRNAKLASSPAAAPWR